jgi:hypothetical protein
MKFRYTLEKSSKKNTCPNCQKRKFVRYIDTENNTYLSDTVGRCDREDNCGYHYKPNDYFKKNPSNAPTSFVIQTNEPPAPPSYIPIDYYQLFRDTDYILKCSFFKYLIDLFSKTSLYFREFDELKIPIPHEVARIVADYKITGFDKVWVSDNNYCDTVVFWQFDKNKAIRTGKIMRYNATTGKRIKEPVNYINWVHGVWKRQNKTQFNLAQCFFGEHLLSENKKITIAIVESEKTACVMSQVKPDYIWLATGGKNGAKWQERSVYKVLEGRTVILYPDLGAFDKWNEIANSLNAIGLNIKVSTLLEQHATPSEKKKGYDILDYAIANNWKLNKRSESRHKYYHKHNTPRATEPPLA